jgi:hypothetical protein
MRKIILYPNEVLRQKVSDVAEIDKLFILVALGKLVDLVEPVDLDF